MPENEFPKLKPHPFREVKEAEKRPPAPSLREPEPYAELCVTSNYTFLTGASHPEEFVVQAAGLGYRAIAISDTHTLAGIVRAHVAAKEHNIHLVIGTRVRPLDMPGCCVFFYATDMAAYRRLCRLLTVGKRRAPKGECHLYFDDLREGTEGLLAIVERENLASNEGGVHSDGGPGASLGARGARTHDSEAKATSSQPLQNSGEIGSPRVPRLAPGHLPEEDALANFERDVIRLRDIFDPDRLSIALHAAYGPDDATSQRELADISARTGVPLVACNEVHYHHPDRRMLQDVLTCVRHGCTLSEAGFRLHANAERYLKPPEEMHRLFAAYPQAIARAVELADRTRGMNLDQLRYEYPDEVVPRGVTPQEYLTRLAWEGAAKQYPEGVPEKVAKQIEHELALIGELNYAPYFLTVHDIVRFARTGVESVEEEGQGARREGQEESGLLPRSPSAPVEGVAEPPGARPGEACVQAAPASSEALGVRLPRLAQGGESPPPQGRRGSAEQTNEPWKPILCQGRGAAANSAVCYCLGVTAVDPNRIDVLFERFVSKERNEPPDIDIDFEHERREEVIQYLYRKYGRERAALTAEVITYRRRSAVRDVGKALGLSLDLVDRLAKDIEWFDDGLLNPSRLRELKLNSDDPTLVWLARLVRDLLGFPRHLSQHVGGFVITRSPLCELVPVENAAMPDRTVIEWDKDDIDAMGMLKVDVLGLGMLSALRRCFEFVNSGRVVKWSSGRVQEKNHGEREVVSRFGRLAKGDVIDGRGLSNEREAAKVGDVRVVQPDAPCGVINPNEHRGGLRATYSAEVHPHPSYRSGFPLRAYDRVRDRNQSATPPHEHGVSGRIEGGRPGPQRPDSQLGIEKVVVYQCDFLRALHSTTRPLGHSTTPLSLRSFSFDDPATYEMIQRADTVGVFQIESRAQMSMLPRLKPKVFYDLVIEVAIVRPGPIQGDMVHPYLRRRNGEEPVPRPAHPAFERVLGKTLGVPLFQEQCMALAVQAAGFTPGEADQLRRAMAAWKRKGDQIYRFGQKLIDGMVANGIPEDFAHRCFEQIKGFSEYGFPESHAASFALLVYASAWLKRHYPAEFCAALLNSQPMGFYAPAQLIRDAREHGVEVRAIDVNHSGWDCSMEDGDAGAERVPLAKLRVSGRDACEMRQEPRGFEDSAPACSDAGIDCTHDAHSLPPPAGRGIQEALPSVRLGFRLVSGMSRPDADRIRAAVLTHGPFRSMLALWRSSGVGARVMRRLAAADAFGSMGLSRQQALWEARSLRDEPSPLFDHLAPTSGSQRAREDGYENLPSVSPVRQVVLDYESTGLSLKAHPVSFVREKLAKMRAMPCADLRDPAKTPDGAVTHVAGIVLVRQRPGTASGVTFMTLEDETGIANLVVWLRVYQKYRRVAGATLLLASGRIQRQGEVVHLVVTRLRSLDGIMTGLDVSARNFH